MTHTVSDEKIKNSTVSAFWFTLILVVLLIAALDFVHVYKQHMEEENHHAVETTQVEHTTPAQNAAAAHEAAATATAPEATQH